MKAKYITNMGIPLIVVHEATGEQTNIGRYGVWDREGCFDTGDDLEALQHKHGPGLPVLDLRKPGS